jgi:hypothetical protein|tara:strand:- start:12291 stop:14528 length:2238 start_codon:yes stop_codon:yes gene_type:complete
MAQSRADLLKEIKSLQSEINKIEAAGSAITKEQVKQQSDLKKELVATAKELKKVNDTRNEALASEESSIKSISTIYDNLSTSQKKTLDITSSTQDKNFQKSMDVMSLNRDIASLTKDDEYQRLALTSKRDDIMKSLDGRSKSLIKNLKEQNSIADTLSNISEEEQEALEKQKAAQEALKSSMQAITETAETFVTNLKSAEGITGLLLIGGGKFFGKLSEVNKELGQVGEGLSGAAGSATVLSFAFGDSAETLKSLSAEMGGLEDATFGAQLQTNLMANNLGISGAEAATLSGSLARLNGGSLETAGNLAAGSREFARMNNIPVSQLMGDVAGSTEEFALFGKDGGKNILQAAGYAAKLGTNMSTISGIADGLLDFESSITKELELGAMLGKNINLDKARQLAMEGDLEGMMKETLSSLGGIDAFNKMDYFQKKATADLLGVSVAELGKMAANQEKAQNISKLMNGDFSNMGESLKAIVAEVGPKMMSWAGGFLTMSAQAGQTWTAFGGGISKTLGKLKGMVGLGKKAAGAATSVAGSATESVAGNVGKVSKGGGIGGMMKGMGGGLKGLAKGVSAFASPQALLGLAAVTGAIIGIGFALKIAAPGIKAFGEAIGNIVVSVGTAVAKVFGGLGDFFGKIAQVATPELALSVLGLAGGFAALTASLVGFSVAGITAIPAMMAVSAFGAASSLLGLGGDAGGAEDNPAWVEELKTTFRETKDVYIDGGKVTSAIASRVNKIGSNSYAI